MLPTIYISLITVLFFHCHNFFLFSGFGFFSNLLEFSPKTDTIQLHHRAPTQSVWVADCYFIVNVLDLPFALPIAIYR